MKPAGLFAGGLISAVLAVTAVDTVDWAAASCVTPTLTLVALASPVMEAVTAELLEDATDKLLQPQSSVIFAAASDKVDTSDLICE